VAVGILDDQYSMFVSEVYTERCCLVAINDVVTSAKIPTSILPKNETGTLVLNSDNMSFDVLSSSSFSKADSKDIGD
jgi:hypothetical protein